MTTRGLFLGGLGAAFVASAAGANSAALRAGDRITQDALFGSLPRPEGSAWTRLIMGSGASYQKQIGLGSEAAPNGGRRLFYEIEVGSPGGSCNPNTLRKAYLRAHRYGSLFDTYPLISNIGRAANLVFRYGDITSGAATASKDTRLRLLDLPLLFDRRAMTISSISVGRMHQANREVEATHIVGDFQPSAAPHEKLRRIELWHAPAFPFGVVRYRATFRGFDPYELETYSFGENYKTDLPLSLDRVRSITKNDQYGYVPND